MFAFHHIPCLHCFYCDRKLYAQCPIYKKVGITAGYAPAGGGFGQYIRIMDWIVRGGVEKIPQGVSFERASLVEPFNTCQKAVHTADPQPGDFVVVLGQGPIGLMFTLLRIGRAHEWLGPTRCRHGYAVRKFGAELAVGPACGRCSDVVKKRPQDEARTW